MCAQVSAHMTQSQNSRPAADSRNNKSENDSKPDNKHTRNIPDVVAGADVCRGSDAKNRDAGRAATGSSISIFLCTNWTTEVCVTMPTTLRPSSTFTTARRCAASFTNARSTCREG